MGGETLQEMRHPPRDWFIAKRWAYQLGYWFVTALFNVFPLPQFSGFPRVFALPASPSTAATASWFFPKAK